MYRNDKQEYRLKFVSRLKVTEKDHIFIRNLIKFCVTKVSCCNTKNIKIKIINLGSGL